MNQEYVIVKMKKVGGGEGGGVDVNKELKLL